MRSKSATEPPGDSPVPLDSDAAALRQTDDARRAALNLLEDAVQARATLEQINVKLRESEERYRSLFNSMDEGYCIIEMIFDQHEKPVDYRFLEVNPAFENQSGMHDVVGKRMLEFVPDIEEHWLTNYGNVVLTGESIRFINEYKALGGRWFDVYAFQVGGEGSRKVAVLFNNIKARIEIERALHESEARFRTLADNMSQFAWTADAKGAIYWYNQRWYDYTGTTPDELRGSGWRKVHHPDHLDRVVASMQRSLDISEIWEDTFPLRGRDGGYRWFLTRAVPIRDAEGGVSHWFGTNTDITEQREIANELRRSIAELDEADRRKNAFLAVLAHELRNPLAPIRNALQLLQLSGADNEVVVSASGMIERQVSQMVRLVDDLLDVSRISRGRIELRGERVELASVIHRAVEVARALVECMSQELTVALPPQSIYVNADAIRLAQVLENLLSNACKFTDKGGRIALTLEQEDGQAVIRVRDSGIGIVADKLSSIFDMFMQIDTSLDRSTGGLGIGLALVKDLVALHDGTVSAHSAGLGQGSEFVVRLPIMVETFTPRAPQPAASEPTPTTPRRILIVDDNRDAADSLAMLLKLSGHEVHAVYDGLEAVKAAATFRPDVALLDIGLPLLNGYEACRRIRGQPWGKDMLLVALTGWGQEEDRQKSQDAGFNAHLVKPVDSAELARLLAELPDRPAG